MRIHESVSLSFKTQNPEFTLNYSFSLLRLFSHPEGEELFFTALTPFFFFHFQVKFVTRSFDMMIIFHI